MTKYQSRFCFAMIAASLICLLADLGYASSDTTKSQLRETMAKVRTGETSNIRYEAARQLEKLTKGLDPNKVDDQTLAEMVSLLNYPEESRGSVALALGNLGPRARKAAVPGLLSVLPEVDCLQGGPTSAEELRLALTRLGVTPPPPPPECDPGYGRGTQQAADDPTPRGQLIKAMVKVRTAQAPVVPTEALQQLAELTRRYGPKKVDDRTLSEIVALLYIPNAPIRAGVATALGNLGPRARKAAAPMLLELLPYVDCIKANSAPAPAIRAALENMGVTPPPAQCEKEKTAR